MVDGERGSVGGVGSVGSVGSVGRWGLHFTPMLLDFIALRK
ncbi:MAG: hypothetical protein SWX82_34650 [Cyanobacteriota bacterium]|nr:hypothetical protein [Cyanobacteriota bacterium]